MKFEAKVESENPTAVLKKLESHTEFEEIDAEQTGADAAFAEPVTEIVIDFISEPENIALAYNLIKEFGSIIISGEVDDDIDPESFIISNTQSKGNDLELIEQKPQENVTKYEYHDTYREIVYIITVPSDGRPTFEMRQEEN